MFSYWDIKPIDVFYMDLNTVFMRATHWARKLEKKKKKKDSQAETPEDFSATKWENKRVVIFCKLASHFMSVD